MKKTLISLFLCAAIVAGAAIPSFALSGTDQTDVNFTGIGVRARCYSELYNFKAKGTVSLSYLPAYSNNQLPESDYTCRARLDIHGVYSNGKPFNLSTQTGAVNGMSASKEYYFANLPNGVTPTSVDYTYTVNGSAVHTVNLP